MTIKGFDVGTAGFVLALLLTVVGFWDEYTKRGIQDRMKELNHRTVRLETAFRSWCTGSTKVETCAKLTIPLDNPMFRK